MHGSPASAATYVTTVWVGRDDFRSLGYREYGGKAALPIWIEYMRVALKDQPIATNDPPDGMVKVAVGAGRPAAADDRERRHHRVRQGRRPRAHAEHVDYGQQQQSQDEEAFDIF